MLKRFKEHFKESIIDIPRNTYAKPVFDNADTDNPKLKPSVRKQLLDGIKQFEKLNENQKINFLERLFTHINENVNI